MALKEAAHPYYVVHAAVFAAYAWVRAHYDAPALREKNVWLGFGLEREWEIVAMLLLLLASKYRRSVTMRAFVDKVLLMTKTCILALLYYTDLRLVVWFALAYAVIFVAVKAPEFDGAEDAVTLNPSSFDRRVKEAKKTHWLVFFYADWCETCAYVTPVFAELSLEFAGMRLKYGKVNVARYPELAEEFRIDTSARSWQLPTIILFSKGEEEKRLPAFRSDGEVIKTTLEKAGVKAYFGLEKLAALSE